jgi:hypothetical protein
MNSVFWRHGGPSTRKWKMIKTKIWNAVTLKGWQIGQLFIYILYSKLSSQPPHKGWQLDFESPCVLRLHWLMVRHDRPLLVADYERCDELNLMRFYDAASFEKVIYLGMLNPDGDVEFLVISINWVVAWDSKDLDSDRRIVRKWLTYVPGYVIDRVDISH